MLREMRPPSFTCRICEGQEHFDDDADSYFNWFPAQGKLEVDEGILALLRGRLDYSPSSESARPHIEKYVRGNKTFVGIRGTLDAALPADKIVSGLEGTVVIDTSGIVFIQPPGLQAWGRLLEKLLATPNIEHIYFSGVPPLAIERGRLLGPEQRDRFTVLSVTMPFACGSCSATSWHQLSIGASGMAMEKLPAVRCSDCGSTVRAHASPSLINKINELPTPPAPASVKRFLKSAPARLEEQRRRYQAKQPEMGSRPSRTIMAAVVGGLFVLGGVGAAAAFYLKSGQGAPLDTDIAVATQRPPPPRGVDLTAQRPAWISSAQPATAYCFDSPEKSSCVGVSSFRETTKEAVDEAWDFALEELVNGLALRAEADGGMALQRSLYWEKRQQSLAAVEELRNAGNEGALRASFAQMSAHRSAVAESLRRTGGAAVPAQQSDSHWEEYERVGGSGTEFLGFVQVEVSSVVLNALLKRYTTPRKLAGADVLPAFPGLAWSAGEAVGGAFVLEAGRGALNSAGAKDHDVVRGVGNERTPGPEQLESAVRAHIEKGRALKLVKLALDRE
jgi:hypothetical protein